MKENLKKTLSALAIPLWLLALFCRLLPVRKAYILKAKGTVTESFFCFELLSFADSKRVPRNFFDQQRCI